MKKRNQKLNISKKYAHSARARDASCQNLSTDVPICSTFHGLCSVFSMTNPFWCYAAVLTNLALVQGEIGSDILSIDWLTVKSSAQTHNLQRPFSKDPTIMALTAQFTRVLIIYRMTLNLSLMIKSLRYKDQDGQCHNWTVLQGQLTCSLFDTYRGKCCAQSQSPLELCSFITVKPNLLSLPSWATHGWKRASCLEPRTGTNPN